MKNPNDFLRVVNEWYASYADTWEFFFTRTWYLLTPPLLNTAAVVMFVLLLWRERWRNRMSRASFGIVSSYALIMDRFLYLEWSGLQMVPQPWALILWSYAFTAALYFGYALAVEWVIPFLIWVGRRLREIIGGERA